MSQVKFYTGSNVDLDDKSIENGAIYFTNENGNAIVAYDMNSSRYFINYPKVLTVAELSSFRTPRLGEIIVVSDATIEDGEPRPNIKIGDGVTSAASLLYIGDHTDITALANTVNTLREDFDDHASNTVIHHQVEVIGNTYIVYDGPKSTQ